MKNSIIFIGIVALIGAGVYFFLPRQADNDADAPTESPGVQQEMNEEAGLSVQDSVRVIDLIGTSATTPFKFASSTDRFFWDTLLSPYPHEYGATTTASFLITGAEAVNFNIWYSPTNTNSFVDLAFFVSNDAGCNNASSTLNLSTWFPLPVKPTTSPAINATALALGAGQTVSDLRLEPAAATAQKYSFAFPDEALNYNCAQVQAYNSSTTDDSTLWVEASIIR